MSLEQQQNDLDLLHPCMRERVNQLLKLAEENGLKVKVFETKRYPARQRMLYDKGYSKLKKGSMHEYGCAVDIVFDDHKPWGSKHPWQRLGQIGKDVGLFWGGYWKSFLDTPHFQYVPATPGAQRLVRKGRIPKPLPDNLYPGDWGYSVKMMQILMNKKLKWKITTDGLFGNGTAKNLKALQRKGKLTPNGNCLGGTWLFLIN